MRRLKIKTYQEFTSTSALEQCAQSQLASLYVPDEWLTGKRASREYLWNVLSTVHTDYVTQCLNHAHFTRMQSTNSIDQPMKLEVCEHIAKIISSMPYVPSKLTRENML